jgi:hypothetical protein
MDESNEKQWFEYLGDLQRELAGAVKSLGKPQGFLDEFRFYSASHIDKAVEGYLFLCSSGRVEVSRLLVRPAIEAMIRLLAVRARPELLFRIAFHEHAECGKLLRGPLKRLDDEASEAVDRREREELKARAQRGRQEVEAAVERALQDFKKRYHEQYPEHEMKEKDLSLYEAAEASGIAWYYDDAYRLYCKFTHASLQATMGTLKSFEDEDSRSMCRSALIALEELVAMKADAPQLSNLQRRSTELFEKMLESQPQ